MLSMRNRKIMPFFTYVHIRTYLMYYIYVMLVYSAYSLFTFSWPRFESGSLCNGGMLALCIFVGSMMLRNSIAQVHNYSTCSAGCLLRKAAAFYLLKAAVLVMPGREKRTNSFAKTSFTTFIRIFRGTL